MAITRLFAIGALAAIGTFIAPGTATRCGRRLARTPPRLAARPSSRVTDARDHQPPGRLRRTVVRRGRPVRNPGRPGPRGHRSAGSAQRPDRRSRQGPKERRRPRRIHLRRAHPQAGRHDQGQPRPVVRGQQPRQPHRVRVFQRRRRRIRSGQRRQRVPDESTGTPWFRAAGSTARHRASSTGANPPPLFAQLPMATATVADRRHVPRRVDSRYRQDAHG